jgi:hypothetical protein
MIEGHGIPVPAISYHNGLGEMGTRFNPVRIIDPMILWNSDFSHFYYINE